MAKKPKAYIYGGGNIDKLEAMIWLARTLRACAESNFKQFYLSVELREYVPPP